MRHPTLSGAELFCSNRVLLHRQLCGRGGSMSTMQAFFLGMMAAWTPSLILLAWLLRQAPLSADPEQ